MSKLRVGHAANSKLNGEYGGHVKKWMKKITSGKRRIQDKRIIREELSELRLVQQAENKHEQQSLCH